MKRLTRSFIRYLEDGIDQFEMDGQAAIEDIKFHTQGYYPQHYRDFMANYYYQWLDGLRTFCNNMRSFVRMMSQELYSNADYGYRYEYLLYRCERRVLHHTNNYEWYVYVDTASKWWSYDGYKREVVFRSISGMVQFETV